ncbi:DegT/DnrJ/EryC1/StrS family aminotransferase [Pedobacter vanadiisoli]|uniref:DegT/DnrJ/EryC1/StrS family aminotransferase n=1 Tax=Pedobacter vanadiisoli TaxID=1761975 RepID=A0ABW5MIH4_9SPHI
MNPIPVNTPLLDGNELKYVTECIETGWISSEGPFITKFEQQFSHYIGKSHGIAVSNGSAALDIAVKALNIGPGDEVIMPTFTIISPAQSVISAGALPVLVDSDPHTWNMDVAQIETKITSRTKAILVVHIYGLPVDIDPVLTLAKQYNLKVIEDAAEMHGQTYKGQKCGSFGDISIFSFYPNKHITTGEGGMLLTNDSKLADRCKKLRNLCFEPNGPRFVHYEIGWNYRMTNLQAALGLAQLEQIDTFIERKRIMGAAYQRNLNSLRTKGYQLPLEKTNYATNIYWVFGLVAPSMAEKEAMVANLTNSKIGTRPFFWCMHEQPVFQQMGLFKTECYPVAEKLARNGFYLPSGLGLKEKELLIVSEIISGKGI